jgi:hypothetical protein
VAQVGEVILHASITKRHAGEFHKLVKGGRLAAGETQAPG